MKKDRLYYHLICLLLISVIIIGRINVEDEAATATKNYPNRPITIIVPFSAGGGLDLVARTLEKLAPKYLGQPLVVVNKLGGDGISGWNELASADPDAYTLGMSAADLLVQPLYGSTKYHYPSALDPIAQVATLPQVMVVSAEHSWKDIDDLIKYAKRNPGRLKCGNGGTGSIPYILGETFAKTAGITIDQVPFRGASEVVVAVLGNHIEIGFVNPATVKEQIKSGTLIALATTGDKRLADPDLAHIPTFKELGFDIVLNNWFGIVAPKELPPEIKTKLEEGFKAMIADPEFKTNIENLGLQVEYLDSDDSKEKWRLDGDKLAKIIQETGILEQIKEQKN